MSGIYENIRILDLSDERGMYAMKIMASFGAEVIKVERPGGNDYRFRGPFAPGEDDKVNKSLSFAYLNTGKKSITLDIESKKGREIFLELVKTSDAVCETFTPGTMEALGLGYEDLKKVNPKIIMLSITPFGQTGPHAKWRASSDLIVDAMGGPMPEMGYSEEGPVHLGYDIFSSGISMFGLFALQAALHNRLFINEGIHIDISQQECIAKWRSQALGVTQSTDAVLPFKKHGGTRQGLVNCKDGHCFVMIGGKWQELLDWFVEKGIDIDVFSDPKYHEHVVEVLTPWDDPLLERFNRLGAFYTKYEFMIEGQRRHIPVGVVDTADTMLNNEHFQARGYYVEVDHPVIGKYQYPGAPVMMNGSPAITGIPAPLLGADNKEIVGGLGFDVDALTAQGIM